MNALLSIDDCKVLWVVGAAERLATLGLLNADVPIKLTQASIDAFVEIDESRQYLFKSDFEIAVIFKQIAREFSEGNEDDIDDIVKLILEYKNNRTEIVKYALSHQTV